MIMKYTLLPRIQVHALLYETAHFLEGQVVSYMGELHETCTCPVRYQADLKHQIS